MTPPSTIAHYRLTTKLGEGGMGAVYRASDTKLNRDVAIKILPEAFASDPDRLARFTREAQVLAGLNHPNIAAIYGIEDRAIIMELVDGPDLHCPLPVAETLPIARQIADALEAAHEKGIVHRDLKPANIKVTAEGDVKVLDFGLAAITGPAAASTTASASLSPTLTFAATQAGMIMGTASYMSPEQAAGKPVDKRADIWSFGVVFWEMLSGRKLFDGETISHTLADVLRADIDLSQLPASTPPAIRKLIGRCLDRNVKTRLRDLGEARIIIDDVLNGRTTDALPTTTISHPSKLGWIIAGVLAAALVPASIGWLRKPAQPPRPLMRFESDEMAPYKPAISPDGSRIVYNFTGSDGVTRLWIRNLDQPSGSPIAGTEDGRYPCISPDNRWVAFFAQNKIRKVSLDGSPPLDLYDSSSAPGIACGDSAIAFATGIRSGITLMSPNGGPARLASPLNAAAKEVTQRYPQFLPGGETIIVTSNTRGGAYENADIVAVTLKTGARKVLRRKAYYGRYIGPAEGPGYLLFISGSVMHAAEMNPKTLTVKDTAVPVLSDLSTSPTSGYAHFDVAENGTAVMITGTSSDLSSFRILDSAGHSEAVPVQPGYYGSPRIVPGGGRVLVISGAGDQTSTLLVDTERDVATKLTFTAGSFLAGICPDGKHFLYWRDNKVWWARVDGGGVPQDLGTSLGFLPILSPDRKTVLFGRNAPGDTASDILMASFTENPDGTASVGQARPFIATQASEYEAEFSPDGRWVAYMSDEAGNLHVFVRPFPGPGGKWQVSTGLTGIRPVWNPRGGELFYLNMDNRIMAVPYTATADSFKPGKPHLWSDVRVSAVRSMRNFDVMPDGKHILALVRPQGDAKTVRATVLLNFYDEVARKVKAAQ